MTFSKSFPRTVKGSTYPVWEEIFLSEAEEKQEEDRCRAENVALMHECIEDAMDIIEKKNLKKFQSDMVNIAVALFEKRAAHEVHFKENFAKEKFDKKFNS